MRASHLLALAAAVLQVGRRPERVLEIGCGEGDGVLFLAREFPAARVRGLERSEEMVRAAVNRFGLDPEGRVAFKAGAPSLLPYPDDFFDLVVHRRGRLKPREIRRVLRPGGELIVLSESRPSFPGRARATWLRRRLLRQSFTGLRTGEAGGEAFLVARLGASG